MQFQQKFGKFLGLYVGSILLVSIPWIGKVNAVPEEVFPLSIVHINDFHARYEPTDKYGGTCASSSSQQCVGGYARTVYTVKQLLKQLNATNPIFLNAGDNFQGTLWYSIGKWQVTSEFLNLLPADAMTLGNHEFDDGVEGLVPFLQNINTSMLVANIDVTHEPTLVGLFQKSIVIERSGRKIGLIGVLIRTTPSLSLTGHVIFMDEVEAIEMEITKLKSDGANIIILISHCGYAADKEMAKRLGDDIDIIIGSHSHTFLYTGPSPPGPDISQGDYPTIIRNANHNTLIVQAGAYAKYVGNITVYFDSNGRILNFEGAPIYMSADVPQDPVVVEHMELWKNQSDMGGDIVLGETKVNLDQASCNRQECNLGNFYCEAMVYVAASLHSYASSNWNSASICVVNAGTFRVPINKGHITRSHLYTMTPYENDIIAFNLPGHQLLAALEYSVSHIKSGGTITPSNNFLQVAGLHVTYNYSRPVNSRVTKLEVLCSDCQVPEYRNIDINKSYRIITNAYLAEGGHGYTMFSQNGSHFETLTKDIDGLMNFTKNFSPLYIGVDGRIILLE